MVSALIFDVDGTLAETEEAHRRAFNETFARHRLDWVWGQALYGRLLKITGGKERMAAYRAQTGSGPDDALIARIHADKTTRYGEIVAEGGIPLRPGVADLVAAARSAGLALGVATTTSSGNVEALCRAAWGRPAAEIFDVIAAGDVVAAKKPAPDIYLYALDRLGLPATDALAFEDSLNGVRAAQAAGLRVIATPGLYTAGEDLGSADWLMGGLDQRPLPAPLAAAL